MAGLLLSSVSSFSTLPTRNTGKPTASTEAVAIEAAQRRPLRGPEGTARSPLNQPLVDEASRVAQQAQELVTSRPERSKLNSRRFGQASIDAMIETAVDDRLASKKTVKQSEFGYGAPSTRSSQQL